MDASYVIGVDYGTDSVRSILVDATDGREVAASVFFYPRWKAGLYCNASLNQFRQHPLDYIEGLETTIRDCVQKAGIDAIKIKAISVDTTGSTPVAVNDKGQPLALLSAFKDNPNAMFVLWKDHTAVKEAAEINAHAERFETNYLQFVGGIYSSEWFWAKLLHVLREDDAVRKACYSWVEHCDWIPFLLTGGKEAGKMKRGVCAAGHKSLWSESWNGLPPDYFFSSLDKRLEGFTGRLFNEVYTSDQGAGKLSKEWAERLGLSTNTIVGIGAFDCHMGAVGGQIEPYHLSKVMGTSTCDMLVAPTAEVQDKLVNGICGQVTGSIIPGMVGMEAGQSAFGDAYAWFRDLLSWPLKNLDSLCAGADISLLKENVLKAIDQILPQITLQAQSLAPDEDLPLAMDWLNGRRTPDANQLLKGGFMDVNLATDAPRFYRALVEATCFGAKAIVDRFQEQGIPIRGVIALGGVARKSPFIMQMMADVLQMPIRVHRSEQTCALGAAMFAATAAGLFPDVTTAMAKMGQGFDKTYYPDKNKSVWYKDRYQRYQNFGNFIERQTAEETITAQKDESIATA